jgi:transcriptional regulator with XRE-family HTH domain
MLLYLDKQRCYTLSMNTRKLTEPQRQAVERLNKIWNAKKRTLELTQEKVSHLCGWHGQSAFSQYLHGRVGMAAEAVLKIAKVLKVEPTEIMPEVAELWHAVVEFEPGPAFTEEQKEVARRLKRTWDEKRETLGLTQEKVAELFGWSNASAVSQYLNGTVALNVEAVLRFAKILRVHPTDIMPELEELLPNGAAQAAKEDKAEEALKLALSILELPAGQRAALLKISNALGSKVDESAASG